MPGKAETQQLMDHLIQFINDSDTLTNQWKFGFDTARGIKAFYKGKDFEFQAEDFEDIVIELYDHFSDELHLIDEDSAVERFYEQWEKVEAPKHPLQDFSIALRKKHPELFEKNVKGKVRRENHRNILKIAFSILGKDGKAFFLSTRHAGILLEKNHDYASVIINSLEREGFIKKVKEGTRTHSPHYVLRNPT